MPSVVAYHRPSSIGEAAELLADPTRTALAGGTVAVPEARVHRAEGTEVVDLQALGLDRIDERSERLHLGAMVRLADLQSDERVPEALRDAARRELPSALRNQATVGGTVALAPPESVLYSALLAFDCEVELNGEEPVRLADLEPIRPGQLVVGLTVALGGAGSVAAAGRTPADDPIVAAVAARSAGTVRLAIAGVAARPVLVDPSSPTADLDPPGDFRGSPGYRLHLASVLARRALEGLPA